MFPASRFKYREKRPFFFFRYYNSCFKSSGMEILIRVCERSSSHLPKCGGSQLLVAVADAGKSVNGKERHLHLNDHL